MILCTNTMQIIVFFWCEDAAQAAESWASSLLNWVKLISFKDLQLAVFAICELEIIKHHEIAEQNINCSRIYCKKANELINNYIHHDP